MEGKEKALEEKTTKYPVEPSEIRTHESMVALTVAPSGLLYQGGGKKQYYILIRRLRRTNLFV